MRSDHPAHRSFWVSIKKCTSHFDPLEPEKRPKRPVFGHQRKKPNRRLRRHRNFGRFGTHLSPVALFVSELRPVFRRESVFTPDEYVFTGLVVRMYRFDVTACAEARRLVQRTESSLRELSVLWTSRRASRAGWIMIHILACSNPAVQRYQR